MAPRSLTPEPEAFSIEDVLAAAQPADAALISGVYFLIRDGQVVYVGSSRSVYARVAQHRAEGVKSFDAFTAIPVPVADLRQVERLYIRRFRPPLNVSVVGRPGVVLITRDFLHGILLRPPSRRVEYVDQDDNYGSGSLRLRVSPGPPCLLAWSYVYGVGSTKAGTYRRLRLSLGAYPEPDLEGARWIASQIAALVKAGIDPAPKLRRLLAGERGVVVPLRSGA